MDGDGRLDILGGDKLWWWENDGEENFSQRSIDDSFRGETSVQAIDLDADGDLDVVAASNRGHVGWWENAGDMTFTAHLLRDTPSSTTGPGSAALAADLDGDGDLDVVGAFSLHDDLSWWENNGDGAWTRHVVASAISSPQRLHAADVDGDGDLDLLVIGGAVVWYENDGWANFLRRTIDGAGAAGAAAVDFDRDGDVDLITTRWFPANLRWWENAGE